MNATATLDTLKTVYDLRDYAAEIKGDSTQAWTIYHRLNELASTLEMHVRHDSAKSAGNTKAQKVIEKMFKAKELEMRPFLQYPWIDKEGRQCACDGYRAFRLAKHLPLAERPSDVGDGINLDKVFPNLKKYQSLALPSYTDLKTSISIQKAKHKGVKGETFTPVWEFGEGLPIVNAQYLLDCMTVIPDTETILYDPSSTIKPLYMCGKPDSDTRKFDEAILLPVRKIAAKEVETTEAGRA